MIVKKIKTKKPPKNPNCSISEAKAKSVVFSGRKNSLDWVPKPKPLPKNIPDPIVMTDWIILYAEPWTSKCGLIKLRILAF